VSKPPAARRKPKASAEAPTWTKELKVARTWVRKIYSGAIKGYTVILPGQRQKSILPVQRGSPTKLNPLDGSIYFYE
jgi:hypothetical protein